MPHKYTIRKRKNRKNRRIGGGRKGRTARNREKKRTLRDLTLEEYKNNIESDINRYYRIRNLQDQEYFVINTLKYKYPHIDFNNYDIEPLENELEYVKDLQQQQLLQQIIEKGTNLDTVSVKGMTEGFLFNQK